MLNRGNAMSQLFPSPLVVLKFWICFGSHGANGRSQKGAV
jgi:hypothetical protein